MKLKGKIKRELLKKRAQLIPRLIPYYKPSYESSGGSDAYKGKLKSLINRLKNININELEAPPDKEKVVAYPLYTSISIEDILNEYGVLQEALERNKKSPASIPPSRLSLQIPVYAALTGNAHGITMGNPPKDISIGLDPKKLRGKESRVPDTLLHELSHAVRYGTKDKRYPNFDAFRTPDMPQQAQRILIQAIVGRKISDYEFKILKNLKPSKKAENIINEHYFRYLKDDSEFYENIIADPVRRFLVTKHRYPKDIHELANFVYQLVISGNFESQLLLFLAYYNKYGASNSKLGKYFRNLVDGAVLNQKQMLEKIKGIV